MKKNKTLWIVLGSLLLLFVLAKLLNKSSDTKEVSTEKASLRTITEVVSISGKIQPVNEVSISSDVSGEIIAMAVQEGDSVHKGQLLCRINPELYQTTMSQLQANLDNARASLSSTEAQKLRIEAALEQSKALFNRQKQLHEQKVISTQDFESAQAQYKMAQADLNAANKNIQAARFQVNSVAARVDEGRKNLGRTSIYAPRSGIVTQLKSKQGERVVGTAQMAGTEMMRISDLSAMEVSVNVNENDVVLIKHGDSADIKLEAYPNEVFTGIVTSVSNSAKFNQATDLMNQNTSFEVKVIINPSSYVHLQARSAQPLKPGMTANIDIKTQSRAQVVTVPVSAVTTRNPMEHSSDSEDKDSEEETSQETMETENKTWVFVLNGTTIEAREVKIGLQDLNYYEITYGLKNGETVVSGPALAIAKELGHQDKVKVSTKEKDK